MVFWNGLSGKLMCMSTPMGINTLVEWPITQVLQLHSSFILLHLPLMSAALVWNYVVNTQEN